MSAVKENNLGKIEISDVVIGNIAGYAAIRCYGVVGMTFKSKADGIANLLKKDSLSKGVKVITSEEGCVLELHIMVENGVNIAAIGDNIISAVSYTVEDLTGIKIINVNIYVDAVRVD